MTTDGTTCVASGNTATDGDDDDNNDYCLSGTWYDCSTSDQCAAGYSCVSNDCQVNITITMNSPADASNTSSYSMTFNATVATDGTMTNVSLYGNWTGSWVINQTNTSGTENTDYVFTKNLTSYGNGVYKWAVRSCLDTGACKLSANRTFRIDTIPPVFSTYARSPDPPNEDQNVQLNATITDSGVAVINAVRLEFTNSTDTRNYTVTTKNGNEYYITMYAAGNYTAHDAITYKWYANDSLGNLNVSAQQSFTVANQAPAITTTQPDGTNDNTKTTFTVTWTASDADGEDTVTVSCYGDADGAGYDKTYTCFTGTANDGTESCDVSSWSDNTYYIWCNATDTYVSASDYSPGELTVDKTVPTPDPATIAYINSTSYSSMTVNATAASDSGVGGVEYVFNETTGASGSTNSSWQASKSYTDTGLSGNTSYCYITQYRDALNNTGTASAQACNYTLAEPPGITQVVCGGEPGSYYCNVTFSMGSNSAGTLNYIDETTGNTGGDDRTWDTSTSVYQDTGLPVGTQYCYRIKARNANGLETPYSSEICDYTARLQVTETVDPDISLPSSAVYVYGHINLSNGTIAANYPFNLWLNGTLYTSRNVTAHGTYVSSLNTTKTTDWSAGTAVAFWNATYDNENVTLNTSEIVTGTANLVAVYHFSGSEGVELPAETGTTGMKGLWHLNDNSTADSSGNGNNGVMLGGLDCTGDEGVFDEGCYFDGSDDYINCSNASGTAFERTSNFTLEAWVELSANAAAGVILARLDPTNNYRGYDLNYNTITKSIRADLINTWSTNVITVSADNSTKIINDSQWHHVAVTYNGSSSASGVNFYVDGQQQSNQAPQYDTLSATILTNVSFTIGSRAGANMPFNGSIDEAAVYNRTLSASEILAHYQRGRVSDSSGFGSNGQLIGAVQVAGKINRSLAFDGGNDYVNVSDNAVLNPIQRHRNGLDKNIDDR